MRQIYNPYLPLGVYIPDGEPHLFGDRVYIYGSHDASGAKVYCPGHYNVWSAPAEDLTDWRDEGTSYLRSQDPTNGKDRMQLWAPDAAQGADGRYYLYYCFPFYPEIGVAVADKPEGPFRFYGHVHYADGRTLTEDMPFDPAILRDDDGRVFLYYGFCPAEEKEMLLPKFSEAELAAMPEEKREVLSVLSRVQLGENSMVAELEPDMMTVRTPPKTLIPGGHHTAGTGFEGHGFFEASSIRKIDGRYYFVYSSHKSHELCYAVSDRPDGGFRYGGTIISNGDIGYRGRTKPSYTLSNNHGGLVQVNGKTYIFYHRGTDGSEFSRQGCAEEVRILPDGSIPQVEMTSCGLNGGPLETRGMFPAAICCHLTSPETMNHIDYTDPVHQRETRIREERNEMFIANLHDGSAAGYKYFRYDHPSELLLEIRGDFQGMIRAALDEDGEQEIGRLELKNREAVWTVCRLPLKDLAETAPLYLLFGGTGELQLRSIGFCGRAGA